MYQEIMAVFFFACLLDIFGNKFISYNFDIHCSIRMPSFPQHKSHFLLADWWCNPIFKPHYGLIQICLNALKALFSHVPTFDRHHNHFKWLMTGCNLPGISHPLPPNNYARLLGIRTSSGDPQNLFFRNRRAGNAAKSLLAFQVEIQHHKSR